MISFKTYFLNEIFKKYLDNGERVVPKSSVVKDDLSKTSFCREGEINQNEKGKFGETCVIECI